MLPVFPMTNTKERGGLGNERLDGQGSEMTVQRKIAEKRQEFRFRWGGRLKSGTRGHY